MTISGREPQVAWHQDEPIGGKPPVADFESETLCAVVICLMCRLVVALKLFVVTSYKPSVNVITNGRCAEWTQFGLHPPLCKFKKKMQLPIQIPCLVTCDNTYAHLNTLLSSHFTFEVLTFLLHSYVNYVCRKLLGGEERHADVSYRRRGS
jgi:hypothetical protein